MFPQGVLRLQILRVADNKSLTTSRAIGPLKCLYRLPMYVYVRMYFPFIQIVPFPKTILHPQRQGIFICRCWRYIGLQLRERNAGVFRAWWSRMIGVSVSRQSVKRTAEMTKKYTSVGDHVCDISPASWKTRNRRKGSFVISLVITWH